MGVVFVARVRQILQTKELPKKKNSKWLQQREDFTSRKNDDVFYTDGEIQQKQGNRSMKCMKEGVRTSAAVVS